MRESRRITHANAKKRSYPLVRSRGAERRTIPLVRGGDMSGVPAQYLNRLSDFLYTAARYAALKEGREEVSYKKA